MKLFLNDIKVEILKNEEYNPQTTEANHFNAILSSPKDIQPAQMVGKVLIIGGTPMIMDRIIRLMEMNALPKLESICFLTSFYKATKDFVKSEFKVVKAAGGVVLKKNKVLMIYRLNRWDLPKGKLEKDETSRDGALREVEEECNVKVALIDKVCSTWHTYVMDGRRTLKKTSWYLMDCLDDGNISPQKEEGIEDIRWMNEAECNIALQNTYNSIREVMACFRQMQQVE